LRDVMGVGAVRVFPDDTIEPSESVGAGVASWPMATARKKSARLDVRQWNGVSRALVRAVKSMNEWPVDAFFVDVETSRDGGWDKGHPRRFVESRRCGDEERFAEPVITYREFKLYESASKVSKTGCG